MSSAPVALDLPAESSRALPRRFGRYKLFDYIGKGGMAEIYLARAETALGAARLCVVKKIVARFTESRDFSDMLIHEAKLAAHLNHTNIVQVFDLGRENGHLFIAMEYVEGMDLNALLRRCSQTKTPLPVEYALHIVCEALQGLDYAHRARDDAGRQLGIVHRDVSPSNVLISLEGEVKLCDFGIAHANDVVDAKGPQIDEAIKGKAGYMSPEHARGEPIDARADVFAVGIVLWELVAGRRLYRAEPGRKALLEQARAAEIPPAPEKGLPEEARLHAIIAKALAPNRERRFASAGIMLRELEEYMRVARLSASSLKLGGWLVERFGVVTVNQRRARELTANEEPPPPSEPTPTPVPTHPPSLRTLSQPPPSFSKLVCPAPSGPWSIAELWKVPAVDGKPAELPPVSAPSSVALGSVDLGPPSSTALDDNRRSRPGFALFAVAVALACAAGVAWLALHR